MVIPVVGVRVDLDDPVVDHEPGCAADDVDFPVAVGERGRGGAESRVVVNLLVTETPKVRHGGGGVGFGEPCQTFQLFAERPVGLTGLGDSLTSVERRGPSDDAGRDSLLRLGQQALIHKYLLGCS